MVLLVLLSESKFFTRAVLVSFVQPSCCTRVVSVALVLHLCCTHVPRVSLVSHSWLLVLQSCFNRVSIVIKVSCIVCKLSQNLNIQPESSLNFARILKCLTKCTIINLQKNACGGIKFAHNLFNKRLSIKFPQGILKILLAGPQKPGGRELKKKC